MEELEDVAAKVSKEKDKSAVVIIAPLSGQSGHRGRNAPLEDESVIAPAEDHAIYVKATLSSTSDVKDVEDKCIHLQLLPIMLIPPRPQKTGAHIIFLLVKSKQLLGHRGPTGQLAREIVFTQFSKGKGRH